jgi:hypothetical protein
MQIGLCLAVQLCVWGIEVNVVLYLRQCFVAVKGRSTGVCVCVCVCVCVVLKPKLG